MTGYSDAEAMNKADKTVVTTKEARQGESAGVIYVLIASGLGAILALAIVGYFLS
jgi:hypothetical protein